LLTCVLMAGAVSATDEEWHEVTTFEALKSNLENGNWTQLGNDITSSTGQIFLEDVDDARFDLNGYNLTMDVDYSAIVIGNTSVSGKASLTVLDSKGGGKVNATNNYLFFVCNESTLTLESGRFEANYSAIAGNANGKHSNPTFTVKEGVELVSHGDVAVFLPAEGTKATITGATITGKLGGVSIAAGDITIWDTKISVVDLGASLDGWTQGPNSDGSAIAIHKLSDSYKGELTLRLLGTTSLSSENGVVFHNYISADQSSLGETEVTIADTVVLNGKITSATYGKNCTGDGGVFKDTNGNILLYPSLNQTGVRWTGDATNGYTLSIIAPGSYKLMDSFTYAPYTKENRLSIVEGGVTLDLNGNTITAPRDGSNAGDTAFISVSEKALTINGNGGGITTTGQSSDSYKACMFLAGKNAQLTINSGTFTSDGIVISENGEVKDSEPVYNNPSIVLNGGTFISKKSTPIYMTADGGKLTVANGVAIQGNTAGIEIRSGTAAINGGTITATGTNNYPALNDVPANPISDGSAIVLVSKPNAYDATISLNIAGDATEITSSNGAAIRNYVRSGDGKTKHTASGETIKIAITGNPKLSGSVAAIENAHYAEDTGTIVGTFNLNGGYYKGAEVLKGDPSVIYPAGYSMTTNADENGYHFVTTATEPNLSEEVTTNPDGTTTVSATSGTITYDAESQTVTMEDTDAGVTLEVTYSEVTEQTETSITGTVNAISTVYDTIDLGDTHAVSLEIQLDTDEPASVIEQLPSVIKSVKEDLVTTALSAEYNNVQIHTLFEALSSDIDGFNGAISDMTITFHISPSAVGTNPNFLVAHFDANGALIDVHTPAVSKDTDGTWRVTITAEKFSGYAPFTGTAKSSGYTSSSSGNMDNAYRVLFNDGATTLSVVTDLSSGDKLTKPETPVKDGYTFAGWYKDEACTQAWDFETGIPGDMTLYAKWTAAGSSGETEATATPTKTQTAVTTPQPTKTQTAAATTSAPEATTAAGVSPTLTQAPAPVAGALFGLLAAGVLLRRRFQ
ncbi:MAG TPA: InlB B-repeat-containing protein, partial [Methanocorpusculum sp.]|nr:InlB B-repeat-containing protein [Methanocorpusculum sp.]